MFVSTSQRLSRRSRGADAGYARGSSSVVTIVSVTGRRPGRRSVRRSSRTVIDAGSASYAASVIHGGRPRGLKPPATPAPGPPPRAPPAVGRPLLRAGGRLGGP